MSYEEIEMLVKATDNLVCTEGVQLSMWYLNEKEEFDNMIYYIYRHRIRADFGLKDIHSYREDLSTEIAQCDHQEAKKILSNHKETWLTLIQKSELSCKYFTSNQADLFKRIIPLARMEVAIPLNSYNFIPQELLDEYQRDPMIELGGHKVLSYVIFWKQELVRRYQLVNQLHPRRTYYYLNEKLLWNINPKQLQQLVQLFKKYFSPTNEITSIVDILRGRAEGIIMWIKSTETLVYFFKLLVKENYLKSQDWGMIITRQVMFCSKQGNIVNHRNINSSHNRIKRKDTLSREQGSIVKTLHNFSLIK